jgi:hypothetical protein
MAPAHSQEVGLAVALLDTGFGPFVPNKFSCKLSSISLDAGFGSGAQHHTNTLLDKISERPLE